MDVKASAPAANPRPVRVRGWVLTYQLGSNWDGKGDPPLGGLPAALDLVLADMGRDTSIDHFVCQIERAPTTGALHIQGYVGFQHPRQLVTVREFCSLYGFDGAHLEPRRGTPQEAWDYCVKTESRVVGPFVHGSRPRGQGDRQDLKSFLAAASELKTGERKLTDLESDFCQVEARYTRYFDRVVQRNIVDRDFPTLCIVYYGSPGTGKTHRAYELCAAAGFTDIYGLRLPECARNTLWWEHYRGQSAVVVDEMGPDKMQLNEFNSLIDSRPFLVQVKGTSAKFTSRVVVITSNFYPGEWFPNIGTRWPAVLRRISVLVRVSYNPLWMPDSTFSNAKTVAEAARVEVLKDDGEFNKMLAALAPPSES